ncbi:hypothetical protein GCM10010171_11560 [Actinokineospora fastidiosa]|uniref:Uncharacterized protein n=1 Tax=Actinokineospora fastidiosa TaxID=1816 RepID=A0A918G732_9PSEU|nr:hypothetical protein GCM10010171_11560 [Actinokineospora fastidiosa]
MTVPLFGETAPEADSPPPAGVPGEQWAAGQFRGRALRIGRNRTVHRVSFLPDERGVEIPAPDCHTGYFAVGRPWWRVYTPTTDRVDCGLCLNGHRGRSGPESPEAQLALPLDTIPG